MKKTFALSVVALTFAACNNSTPQQTDNTAEQPATTEETPMVGGDRDEHGCIGSAGYTWSALRGECIQVFEVGTFKNGKYTYNAQTKELSIDGKVAYKN